MHKHVKTSQFKFLLRSACISEDLGISPLYLHLEGVNVVGRIRFIHTPLRGVWGGRGWGRVIIEMVRTLAVEVYLHSQLVLAVDLAYNAGNHEYFMNKVNHFKRRAYSAPNSSASIMKSQLARDTLGFTI